MRKQICTRHLPDPVITRFIKSTGEIGACDYCGGNRERKVVYMDDLGELLEQGLRTLHDDSAQWLGYNGREGGYQGETFNTEDLHELHLEGDVDYDILGDLAYEIERDTWCEFDPHGDRENDLLKYNWQQFQEVLCHQQRFTIFQTSKVVYKKYKLRIADILDDVGKMIIRLRLIKKLPAGTVIYRCRQHFEEEVISRAGHICSPSLKHAKYANRMSPAGISMFYGAFKKEAAILETVEQKKQFKPLYTVATFRLKHAIEVIDFSAVPPIPSIFDLRKLAHYQWKIFLQNFVADLTRPINKEDDTVHIDYAPTQVVTEYCRYVLSEKKKKVFSGMIYPSSLDKKNKSIVLFYDHEESLEQLIFDEDALETKHIDTIFKPS